MTNIRGQRATMNLYDDCYIDTEAIGKLIKYYANKSVIAGCSLCGHIWSSLETYKESGERYGIIIVIANNRPWLYSLYDGYVMPIKYCPKCGRKLI